MTRPARVLPWLLAGAALAVYALHAASFGNCLQDDAYISLRYARNFAEGHGLVYNPGERVEGYTNFLWTLLSAVPFVSGTDPASFLRVVGALSGIGALAACAFLAARLAPARPGLAAGAAALCAAALPFLVVESIMGLETALFGGLVAFALARRLGPGDSDRGAMTTAAVFGLASLTRPEGLFAAALAGAFDLPLLRRAPLRTVRRWLPLAVLAGAHLAFRLAYYGEVVPNTFHAKVGGGMAALSRGAAHFAEFAADAWPLLLLGGCGAALLLARAPRRALPVLVVVLGFLVYVVYVGGDYKPSYRFFALPALLLAALGTAGLAEAAGRRRPRAAGGLVVGSVLLAGGLTFGLGDGTRDFALYRAQELPVHLAAGRWLGRTLPAGSVIATCNAGALPFAAGLPTIDMCGLCDERIAKRPVRDMGRGMAGHEKTDARYVLGRTPDVILLMEPHARFSAAPLEAADVPHHLLWASDHEMWSMPAFHADYAFRSVRLPGFYLNLFVRKDAPWSERLPSR